MADLNTTDDKKSKNIFISQSIFPNYILLRDPKRNSKSVSTIPVSDTKNDHKNPALPPKTKQSVIMKSPRIQNEPIIHSMFPKINQDPYFVQTLQLLKKRRHSHLIMGQHISNKHKNSANLSLLNTNLNSIEQCLNKRKQYLIQLNKMKKTGQLNSGLYGRRVQMIDFLGEINENVVDEEKPENKQRVKSCQDQLSIQKMKINQFKQKRCIEIKPTKRIQRSQRIKTQLSKGQKKSPKRKRQTRQAPQFISINKINILQPFKIQTQYLHLIKIYTQKTEQQNKDSPNKKQDSKKQLQQSNASKIKIIKNSKRKNKKILPNSFALAEGKGISPWQSFSNNFLDKLM